MSGWVSGAEDVWATFSSEKSSFLLTYCVLGILVIAFEKIVYQAQADVVRERTSMLEEAIRRLSTQIEERQRAEAALQVSEERFRTFSEASY